MYSEEEGSSRVVAKGDKVSLLPVKRLTIAEDDHTIKLADFCTAPKAPLPSDNQATNTFGKFNHSQSLTKTFEKPLLKKGQAEPQVAAPRTQFRPTNNRSKLQQILEKPSLRQKHGHLLSKDQPARLDEPREELFTLFTSLQNSVYMHTTFRNKAPCFYHDLKKIIEQRTQLDFTLTVLCQILTIEPTLYELKWARNSNYGGKYDLLLRTTLSEGLHQRRTKFRRLLASADIKKITFSVPAKPEAEEEQNQLVQEKANANFDFPDYDVLSFKPFDKYSTFQQYIKEYVRRKERIREKDKVKSQNIRRSVSTRFLQRLQQFYVMKRVTNAFKETVLSYIEKQRLSAEQLSNALREYPEYVSESSVSGAAIIKINRSKFRQTVEENKQKLSELGVTDLV